MNEALEQSAPVNAAHHRVDQIFRMRHHAKHVHAFRIDSGDIVYGAVAIGLAANVSIEIGIAEGDAALALVMASPVCEFVREVVDGDGDKMIATCTAKRRGYPEATVSVFSMADAKRAGLAGKTGPWTQYPRRMVQLRARGFALRDAFPDVLKGLVTAEEAQDYPETPAGVDRSHGTSKATPVPQPAALTVSPAATPSPVENVRLAVSRAGTLDALDTLRKRLDQRLGEGVFTASQHDELVTLMHHKAEMLIGDSDSDTEHFDAAEVAAEARA